MHIPACAKTLNNVHMKNVVGFIEKLRPNWIVGYN